ncbi:MAG: S-layer family protein [Limnohabitans sp.]|nr:MAG: S-layer family protein [Limnohabitans sp.]
MTIQRKTLSPASPTWPRHALGRACLLALACFSSVGWAQTVPGAALSVVNASLPSTETAGAVWSANYGLITGESQFGEGMLDASIAAVPIGSRLTGGGVSPVTVSNNTLQSLAFGNQTSSSTGLSLLTSSLLSRNLQSLSGTIIPASTDPVAPAAIGSLSVSATVSGSSAFITQSGMQSADLALTGNTLKASTQLNVADTRVSGAVPSGFTSAATGSSEVAFDAGGASIGTPTAITSQAGTTGTVNLSTLQSTFSASPTATVSASNVTLTVSGTPVVGEAATSQFTNDASVNGNTLSATTGINTATSIFQAEAGSAAWTGSVSVTNLQNASTVDGTTDSLASVSGSAVTADLRFGLNGQTDLTGSLTLSDNKISATSTGNSAGARTTSGAIAAGNAITFDGGADVTGSASGTGTSVNLASGTAQAVADLTLLNAQANAASSFTTTVTDGGVTSRTDNLAGGTLTQSGNAITASSTANLAGNLVSAGQGGNVANFTASVAALNVQSNTGLASTASVESSAVSAVVGIADAVPTGTVTLSNNTLAATAEGNLGVTTVALKADNLTVSGTLGEGATQGVTLTPATGSASAGLGVVALSAQSNAGGSLTANNEGTSVSLSFNDQALVPADVDISAMNATLSGNRLQSTATANSASTSATLEGSNGTGLSAAVGNSQRNTDMAVSAGAGATTPLAVSLTAGAVTASTLTLADNSLSAAATGNSASSRLSVSLATASGDAALSPSATASVGSTAVTSLADVALANSQINDTTDVTAAMAGRVSLDVGAVGSVANTSTLVVSTNQIGATAEVNRASNALALDVGTLSGMTSALASQQVISDSVATASTVGTVELLAGAVAGSALTLSGNTVKSTSLGNVADNQLSLAGTNATGSSAVVAGTASATAGTSATTQADVAVANLQSSSDIALSATTVGAAGIDVGTVLADSALTLSNNTTSALALSNSASNTLDLASTNVNDMAAAVVSSQRTIGTVDATVSAANPMAPTSAAFLIDATSATSTPVVLSKNTFSAVAGMNEAFNTLTAAGATLLGNGGTPSSSVGVASTTGVDFSVVNAQSGEGSVSALADPGTIGFTGSLTGGSLSITENTVLAKASVNTASNQLTLAATSRLEATAAVNNVQVMDSVVSATVVDSANAPSILGATLTSGGASTVAVSDNRVTAQATGNLASNALNATAVSGISSSGSSVQPTFAVLNSQTTQATGSIAAVLNGTNLGASLNGTGGSTSVQGNQMVALAYGNSVDNVIGMSALPGGLNTASAAITSVQYNMASISATVSGASLAASGTVSGTGTANVSGNTITAQVVGNRSVNSIAAR